jgi:hypothetical protein
VLRSGTIPDTNIGPMLKPFKQKTGPRRAWGLAASLALAFR